MEIEKNLILLIGIVTGIVLILWGILTLGSLFITFHNSEHGCTEVKCPNDFSDFSKACMPKSCTISDDAVIDNRIISVSKTSIDLIKDDAYTRGMIDGRASILEEQSTTGYTHTDLGVQRGYEPSPYPQWREYANCIARNDCARNECVNWYGQYGYIDTTCANGTIMGWTSPETERMDLVILPGNITFHDLRESGS